MRVVAHVSAKFGKSELEVTTVLRVQLNVSVSTQQSKLAVVVRKYLKLYDIRIDASFYLHGEFSRVVNFQTSWVNTTCHDKVLVIGDSESLAANGEVHILNQVDSVAILIQVLELDISLFGFLHVLRQGFPRREVVNFDSV